jgi:hypothetical protein
MKPIKANNNQIINQSHRLQRVVTIVNPLYQSIKGNYYVGQTPSLKLGKKGVYAAINNCSEHSRNLFVNVFTITNFSSEPILAQIWLRAKSRFLGKESKNIANTNGNQPQLNGHSRIIYSEQSGHMTKGTNVFDRIVPPYSTVVAEEDGKYIIPPKELFIVTLHTLDDFLESTNAAIAFGWYVGKEGST